MKEISARMKECQKRLGESLFLKIYTEASRQYRDNLELILADLEKADPPETKKLNILGFREKLHSYQEEMDGKYFINTFLDARSKYGDNLEMILQEMEKGKIEYQNSFKEAKNL